MKLMTFTVPCYNSAGYMSKCIDSLLKGGDEVEILIIDDGSKDETGAIADRYEREHPGICKAIHQETAAMARASTRGSGTPPGSFSRSSTRTTGSMKRPLSGSSPPSAG